MKTRKNRLIGLTVAGLSRSVIYKPLAILMAILLAPVLSWMESGVGGGSGNARPFQAQAQTPPITLQGCTATGNSIIQSYCANGVVYYNDLVELEKEAVEAYLAAHNLPASEAHVVYDYGRADLRNAVRGYIDAILIGVISTPPESRTPHQKVSTTGS